MCKYVNYARDYRELLRNNNDLLLCVSTEHRTQCKLASIGAVQGCLRDNFVFNNKLELL